MSFSRRILLSIAGLSLLTATIAGAVASHVLTGLDERALHSFETAVQFQFFHGLGLIGVVLAAERGIGGRTLDAVAWLLVAGVLLFSGSIYAATFGAPRGILALAPYGGVTLMLAWLLLAVSPWLARRES
jgi:uncharacterized membrane protein YgdD (TMEM256/DUF423 family)